MPERARYLREQFEKGFDETLFKRIWPNMTVISSIGNASFKPSAEYIRSFAKGIALDFSIYGASEALVAACYELENTDMQLLTDFGERLGTTDADGQLAHIAHYREIFAARLDDARQEAAQKAKLYKTLGLFGGVSAALLLW